MKTKTFKDLKFKIHGNVEDGLHGTLSLHNGINISIATMLERQMLGNLYGNLNELTFEMAAFDANNNFIKLGEGDDVLAYQTVEQINTAIKELEKIKYHEDNKTMPLH